jgi:hypothetical protein
MKQVSFTLPLEENITKLLPAGDYKVTVSGLTKGTVSVEARNVADDGYDAAVTFTSTDSGKIGSKAVTINANGQVRCSIASEANPGSCKVRISA